MRTAILTLLFASVTAIAVAQTPAVRPESAPAASAAYEVRERWCETYAAWYLQQVPQKEPVAADARPTHMLETEITYCKTDPQNYERETTAELSVEGASQG